MFLGGKVRFATVDNGWRMSKFPAEISAWFIQVKCHVIDVGRFASTQIVTSVACG